MTYLITNKKRKAVGPKRTGRVTDILFVLVPVDLPSFSCGPMDKAPAYGAGDSRFESVQWYDFDFFVRKIFFELGADKNLSPGRARTSDLTVNSRSLWPTELQKTLCPTLQHASFIKCQPAQLARLGSKPETMLSPCMASYHNPNGAAGGEPCPQKYAPLSGGCLFHACRFSYSEQPATVTVRPRPWPAQLTH